MTRRIKAIFFDLDDTLVLTNHIDGQAYERVCALARQLAPGLDEQALIAHWRLLFGAQPWDPEHQVDVEEWRAGLWRQAVERQGLQCSSEAAAQLQACFSSTRLELFQFLPGDLVASLSRAGYSMVIITNGHYLIQRQKVESCQAARLFEHILVGGEEVRAGRDEKPQPIIFKRACEMAQCHPQEAIHVGDSLSCDVQGGINGGLAATVWINASGRALPEGAPRPDFVLASVLELPGVLAALEAGQGGCCGDGGSGDRAAADGWAEPPSTSL